jgi:hypothetical protein
MLDKVKANSWKGNPNASSADIAMIMLQSVVAKRPQLIELAARLDATMVIPNVGDISICDMLLKAIPLSIPVKASKSIVGLHMVDIWVILSAVLKKGDWFSS